MADKPSLLGPAIGYGGKENEPARIMVKVQVDSFFIAEAFEPKMLEDWISRAKKLAKKHLLESHKLSIVSHDDGMSHYIIYTGVRFETEKEQKDRLLKIQAHRFHALHEFRMRQNFYDSQAGKDEIKELAKAYPNHKDILLGKE